MVGNNNNIAADRSLFELQPKSDAGHKMTYTGVGATHCSMDRLTPYDNDS